MREKPLQTVASLVDSSTGPNLVNRSLFHRLWHNRINPDDSRNLRTATKPEGQIDATTPIFERIDELFVRTWFKMAANTAADALLDKLFQ